MTKPESDERDSGAAVEAEESLELPRTKLSAEDALERIRRGQLIENVTIDRIAFRGEFTEPVRLRRVMLLRPRFDGAVFRNDVQMTQCVIERPHFGNQTEFHKGWTLTGSTLVRAQVVRVVAKGLVNLEEVQSRGKLVINHCIFEGRVRLWEAKFHGWTEFKECEFRDECDFRSFHAHEGFVLKNCQFFGHAILRGAAVVKKLDFTQSRFEGMLDLSKCKLHDYVYLESIQQGQKQQFAFSNIIGDRLRVKTEQLAGRMASEEHGDHTTAMQEYAFLRRVFENLHRYDQEDWAFYRFKVNQRRCCQRSWLRPWTKVAQFLDWLVLDLGCGYCTDPFRAIRTAVILIVFFALIYATWIDALHFDHEPPFGPDIHSLANRVTIGMFQSVATFTSGLSSIQDIAKGWMNAALILESLLGTLLWGLFIVAFSRKVIR